MAFDVSEFHSRMVAYFAAEKRESVLFLLAGLAALVAATALLRSASVYRGMVTPLALVGLIQLFVGGGVLVRSDGQVAVIERRLAEDPAALGRDERARMERVMANFRIYKLVEVIVLAAGIALTFAFAWGRVLHAVGIGCLIQGALMLTLDLFAEGRGQLYLAALRMV